MTEQDNSPPAIPPESEPETDEMAFTPMPETITFVGTFEHLLKKPGSIIHRLHQPAPGLLLGYLFLASLLCFLSFGTLLGTFSLGDQLWASPLKVVVGIFFSAALCLPSLYIFSCLNGLTTRFVPIVGILIGIVTLTGLLLLGFSPVVWIFSQSTESRVFMGTMVLAFWILSFFVGASLLGKLGQFLGASGTGYLRVWMMIFLVVTLQMSTTLRPILSPLEEGEPLLPEKKKSFVTHWIEELGQND